jgi:hypothetical protein
MYDAELKYGDEGKSISFKLKTFEYNALNAQAFLVVEVKGDSPLIHGEDNLYTIKGVKELIVSHAGHQVLKSLNPVIDQIGNLNDTDLYLMLYVGQTQKQKIKEDAYLDLVETLLTELEEAVAAAEDAKGKDNTTTD